MCRIIGTRLAEAREGAREGAGEGDEGRDQFPLFSAINIIEFAKEKSRNFAPNRWSAGYAKVDIESQLSGRSPRGVG